MNKMFLAGAAALALIATPSLAQVQPAGPEATTSSVQDKRGPMNDEQRAVYDAMPSDQRTAFDAWEPDRQVMYFGWDDALRGYYWQLDPVQQEAWWYLDDPQRITLFQLQPAQRDGAWNSIVEQVNRVRGGAQSAAVSSPAYTREEIAQATPAAQRPAEYPICSSDQDDSCINPWAAGKRGPGVTRPLDHWPGDLAGS